MGDDDRNFIERAVDAIDDAVGLDEKTGKVPGGFDPDVCYGKGKGYKTTCPEKGKGPKAQTEHQCGLCGCPVFRNGTLDMAQRTPEGCPREEAHKE